VKAWDVCIFMKENSRADAYSKYMYILQYKNIYICMWIPVCLCSLTKNAQITVLKLKINLL
jgi:hypothetical protein